MHCMCTKALVHLAQPTSTRCSVPYAYRCTCACYVHVACMYTHSRRRCSSSRRMTSTPRGRSSYPRSSYTPFLHLATPPCHPPLRHPLRSSSFWATSASGVRGIGTWAPRWWPRLSGTWTARTPARSRVELFSPTSPAVGGPRSRCSLHPLSCPPLAAPPLPYTVLCVYPSSPSNPP